MAAPRWQTLLTGIRDYVHAQWLATQPTTINGAAKAVGEVRERAPGKGETASTPVLTAFDHLQEVGIAILDPERSTRKQRVFTAWNWTGLPLEGQTLRDAIEPYLLAPTAPADAPTTVLDGNRQPSRPEVQLPDGRVRRLAPVPRPQRDLVVSAVRALVARRFGEAAAGGRQDPAQGYPALLAACARIAAAEFVDLPAEAQRATESIESGKKYRSAMNTLREYAARHDLVALWVAPPEHAHPWSRWCAAHGVTQRSTLYHLHEALQAMRGSAAPADLDGVTIATAAQAIEWVAARKGSRAARDLKALLVTLGLEGKGPFKALLSECGLVRTSARTIAPRWLLPTTSSPSLAPHMSCVRGGGAAAEEELGEGDAGDEESGGARATAPRQAQSWATTAALFRAPFPVTELLDGGVVASQDATECLPPLFADFYEWYAAYSMLPLETLRVERGWGEGFARPAIRHLDAATTRQRHHAARAWHGVALFELGIRPAACTAAALFGARFRQVAAALRRAHARRVHTQARLKKLGLPIPGHQVTADSPTIDRHIINAGLIAEGLATWATWRAERGAPVASAEEITAWREAYAYSAEATKAQDAPTADVSDPTARTNKRRKTTIRSRQRTQKDVAVIMQDPSSLALVKQSARRLLHLVRTAPRELETALAVQRGYIGALVAMGMPRVGELGVLEYERHFRTWTDNAAGLRVVEYFGIDAEYRKAGTDHQLALVEDVFPKALREWHRTAGRDLLQQPWLASGQAKHDFVFCSPEHGGPFGGMPDYGSADPIARLEHIARCESNASSAISTQYEQWRRAELARHPSEAFRKLARQPAKTRGQHTAHGSRNQITRLCAELALLDRLAFLLGHLRRDDSVAMYGTSLAALNAETIQRIMNAALWDRGAAADAHPPATVDGGYGRSRAAQAQMLEDSALGRRARELLGLVNDLTPNQALQQLMVLSEMFKVVPQAPGS